MDVKRRILIVDDSSSAREQIKAMLPIGKIEIIEASTAQMAHQAILLTKKFDLAFFDINMPGMSGLDLAEKVKNDIEAQRYKRFPIVMVTTENTMDKVLRGKAAGVVGWIVKPAKQEMIEQLVKKFAA